jgi:CRP-like cAMP-binding protein
MIDTTYSQFRLNFQTEFTTLLNQQYLPTLEKIFIPVKMKKGDYFIRQGDVSNRLGFVIRGAFRSFVINETGNDITKYFYVEGSMLFSYAAYIQKKESSASIQALEDSEIRVASMSDLEEALNNDYQLMLLFKSKLDEVLMMKDQRASSFTMLNSTDRYRQFLVDYPGLEDRVRQYHLASYLGITPVSLSRIRKKLGIIK